MNTHELLTSCRENTAHAHQLLGQLVAAAGTEGLPAKQVRPAIEELNRRLRDAATAAQALQTIAVGMSEPKRGD